MKTKTLSRDEIVRRIEEDRERHKRLREKRWVQTIPPTSFPIQNPAYALAVFAEGDRLPMDIEFENEWENTSDWNEDDDEIVREEMALCFGTSVVNASMGLDLA